MQPVPDTSLYLFFYFSGATAPALTWSALCAGTRFSESARCAFFMSRPQWFLLTLAHLLFVSLTSAWCTRVFPSGHDGSGVVHSRWF